MLKTERLSIKILPRDKEAIERLASNEGEPMAVLVRRLIRNEARRCGFPDQVPAERCAQAAAEAGR